MHVPRADLDCLLSTLTPRERQIVAYVAAGRPNNCLLYTSRSAPGG